MQVGSEIEYSQSKGQSDKGGHKDLNKTYNTSSLKDSVQDPKSNSSYNKHSTQHNDEHSHRSKLASNNCDFDNNPESQMDSKYDPNIFDEKESR